MNQDDNDNNTPLDGGVVGSFRGNFLQPDIKLPVRPDYSIISQFREPNGCIIDSETNQASLSSDLKAQKIVFGKKSI